MMDSVMFLPFVKACQLSVRAGVGLAAQELSLGILQLLQQ